MLGLPLDLMKSYLTSLRNGYQLLMGVLVYINDLPSHSQNSKKKFFAADTAIVEKNDKLFLGVSQVSDRMKSNHLTLNKDKTKITRYFKSKTATADSIVLDNKK